MGADDPAQFAVDAVRATLGKSTDVDACVALTERIDALTSCHSTDRVLALGSNVAQGVMLKSGKQPTTGRIA